MQLDALSKKNLLRLLDKKTKHPLASQHYPSRGQTAVQEIYQTRIGKLFLKKTSLTNLRDCQIDIRAGSLAEREYWAYRLAQHIGIKTPELVLLDKHTTVQFWLDFPDAATFATVQGRLQFSAEDVFDCSLFDWLTGQSDRHNANYLYNFADQQIILIDSAFSFLKHDPSLPHYLEVYEQSQPNSALIKPRSSEVLNKIHSLSLATLDRFVPLRDDQEQTALNKRLLQLQNAKCIQDIIQLYRRK